MLYKYTHMRDINVKQSDLAPTILSILVVLLVCFFLYGLKCFSSCLLYARFQQVIAKAQNNNTLSSTISEDSTVKYFLNQEGHSSKDLISLLDLVDQKQFIAASFFYYKNQASFSGKAESNRKFFDEAKANEEQKNKISEQIQTLQSTEAALTDEFITIQNRLKALLGIEAKEQTDRSLSPSDFRFYQKGKFINFPMIDSLPEGVSNDEELAKMLKMGADLARAQNPEFIERNRLEEFESLRIQASKLVLRANDYLSALQELSNARDASAEALENNRKQLRSLILSELSKRHRPKMNPQIFAIFNKLINALNNCGLSLPQIAND